MNPRRNARVSGFLVNTACCVVIVAGMKAAAPIVVQLLLGVFLAVVTTPLFFWLRRHGVPAVVALFLLIVALVGAGAIGWLVLSRSLRDFAGNLLAYTEGLRAHTQALTARLEGWGIEVSAADFDEILNPKATMRFAANTVSAVSGAMGRAFVVLLVTVFFLLEAAILPRKIRAIRGIRSGTVARLDEAVDHVRHYMGMKTLLSLLTGVLVGAMLAVFRIPYPILLAALAFFLNYVPTVGSIVASVPGVLLALLEYGPERAVPVAVCYMVINVSIGNLLEPRVMGRGLGLSPVIVVLSLIVWGWVLGPIGMLLSVPLTMAVKLALEEMEETRGIALLMGSGRQLPPDGQPPGETKSNTGDA